MSLFRGAEYSRLTQENGKEPLTFYDMNLSAQDHQTFFACEVDEGKPDYEIMQRAWRERNQTSRIALANEALTKNPEYAYLLSKLTTGQALTDHVYYMFQMCTCSNPLGRRRGGHHLGSK